MNMFEALQCFSIIVMAFISLILMSNSTIAVSLSSHNGSSNSSSNYTNQLTAKQLLSIETNSVVQKLVVVAKANGGRSLKRVFLSNRTVTCNDGSMAGFYLRKSPSSKKWIVFLEGGWHCYDTRSCQARWMKLRHLMTSANWPENRDVGGILSPLPEENPYWYNANHVLVPYCSSDSWSGTKAQATTRDTWAFMGSLILRQVIADLIPLGLGRTSASELFLVGSSAGGLGVMLNLDRINHFLQNERNLKVTVRGISDSGWFLDREPYAPSAVASSEAVRQGWKFWEGLLPEACTKQHIIEPWRCYFGYRLYPTLESTLFVFQWLFDEAQMSADNVATPVTPQQWNYIHEMGGALRSSLDNVTAVFAPSCIGHAVLSKRDWINIKIDDISLPKALRCWEQSTRKYKKNSSSNNSGNSKMRRSTEASVMVEKKHNSNRRKHNQRHKNTDELSNGNPQPQPRHNRHLTKEERQQNRKHNNQKRNKNKNHRRKHVSKTDLNSQKHVNSISGNEQISLISSDRPFKNRKRSRKDSDLNRHPENQDFDRRKKNRQRRKRRKEQRLHEQEFRQFQREQAQQQHDQQKDRLFSNNSQQFANSLIRYESTTSPALPKKCGLRLLERCSWPQCNHSCPSLRNPRTGEEMRFLELLSSFGLDIEGVAAALGVDMQTLNNMDRTELVNLLTQQVN